MATSSIFANIVIDDPKQAEAFADLLEELSQEPKRKPVGRTFRLLTDPKEIDAFFTNTEGEK